MGKKGFNWKARVVHETKIDNTETNKIHVELPTKEYGAEDSSNVIVLPSSKRETKVKKEYTNKIRILSKHQRKKLEKVVDKKKKKENRAALLEALAKVQIPAEELQQMISISTVQSKGLKKNLQHVDTTAFDAPIENTSSTNEEVKKIKSLSGAKKRKFLLSFESNSEKKKAKQDLNVVGFDPSSESEDESVIDSNDIDTTSVIPDAESDNKIEEHLKVECVEVDKEKSDDVVEVSDDEKDISITNKKESLDIDKVVRQKRNKKKEDKEEIVPNKINQIVLPKRETTFVQIDRDPELQVARLKLPILAEEQSVVECINENAIVIVAGETGSGKTTQIPQFLYEAGYAKDKMIGITEPRRVAAVAMSSRVATEMCLTSREVSYLMRYEGNVTEATKIKFMTDGVLLKEIESDFTLSKYSVIIVDEAHERSVFTDILIGLLSRIVPLRCKRKDPLRFIIMSATLRIEDFTENSRLFKYPPPVINIEARQFPVTIHFNKKTEEDYLKAAFSKAIKIHTKLPEGGILIFVTGQQEVNLLVKKLRQAFPFKNNFNNNTKSKKDPEIKNESTDGENEEDDDLDMMFSLKKVKKVAKEKKSKNQILLPKIDLDDFDALDEEVKDDLLEDNDDLDGSGDEDDWEALATAGCGSNAAGPLWVLPLYSMLPPQDQAKVFESTPDGCRVCVVATNVAETSLTIPNVKYVIDTGKQKIRIYEKVTGASAMRVVWISQASAQQRAGRAGRCAPGHCYRLYSSAVFQHDFPKDKEPEIRTRPIDDLLLQMKCMGIDKVINFPFPSAPDILQLKTSEMRLEILGALEKSIAANRTNEMPLKVTPLGRAISGYPVLPRYGKMLALSHQHDLFQYTICMVAALSVQEVFIGPKRKWMAFGENLLLGDPGVLLNIVGASEHAALSGEDMEKWCVSQGVRYRALREIRLLRGQLAGTKGVPPAPNKPPGALARPLRQILLAGLGDCVAKKVPLDNIKDSQERLKLKYAYNCPEMEDPVFIHSGSALRKHLPEWVVYQEIYEAGDGENAKMVMRGVTAIEPEWLPIYAPKLCNLGEPLTDPCPRYDKKKDKLMCHVNASFGRSGWQLPVTEVEFPKIADIHRWFAVYLLDGVVISKLKKYTKDLLSPPTTMIKSWAKLQPRTEAMYRALLLKQMCSKKALFDEWKENPTYLLEAYKKWLPVSAHDEVTLFWPPVE